MHDEDNSSKPEDESSEQENVIDIDTYEYNGEQNVQESKILTTNFEV